MRFPMKIRRDVQISPEIHCTGAAPEEAGNCWETYRQVETMRDFAKQRKTAQEYARGRRALSCHQRILATDSPVTDLSLY